MTRWRRLRRWVVRGALALLGLALVCLALGLLVLAHLDAGPIKRRVQSLARERGVDLDYRDAGVTLGGLAVRDLEVLSPQPDRALARTLLSIGQIDGSWSPLARRVDELVVRDVAMTVVVDPDGTTSLDRWLAGLPEPEEPPPSQPLSRLLASLLPRGVAANARIERVSVTLIRRAGGDRIRLDGIQAAAKLKGGALAASLGPGDLRLTVGEREAVAHLQARVALEQEGQVRAAIALSLVRQNLAPELPAFDKLLDLTVTANPAPADQRTHFRVEKMMLLDGAATLEASGDLPDAGDPVIHAASSRVDLVALARAVPADLGPILVDAEPLRITATDLAVAPVPRGTLQVTGSAARLAWRDFDAKDLVLRVDAHPEGTAFRAAMNLQVGQAGAPGQAVSNVKVDLEAERSDTLAIRGAIDVERASGPALVEGLHIEVGGGGIAVGSGVGPSGAVKLTGRIARASVPGSLRAHEVGFRVDAGLSGEGGSGRARARAAVEVAAARLFVPALGPELAGRSARVALDVPGVEIDLAEPGRASGEAKLEARLGDVAVGGTVARTPAALTWDFTGRARRIGPARELALRSRGSAGDLIEEDTTIRVGRLALTAASVRGAALHLSSSGTLRRQSARMLAVLDGAKVRGTELGGSRVELAADVDLDRRHAELRIRGMRPAADLHLLADIDGRRILHWETRGRIGPLGALGALLPAGLDWSRAALELRGRGALAGVVAGERDGVPVLVRDPLATARGEQAQELTVRDIHFRGADETGADLAALHVRANLKLGDPHTARVELDVPAASARAAGARIEVDRFTARLDASLGRAGDGSAELSVKIGQLRQSALPAYPVRDAEINLAARGSLDTAVALHASLTNPGGGTSFQVSGQLERDDNDEVPGRRSLTLDGRVEQALDRLAGAPETLRARGRVAVPFRIESGDLALYRASGRISLEDVGLELPRQNVTVVGIRGELPILEEILVGPGTTEIVGRGERGLYSQLRFADHHPFLGISDYLTVERITVGGRAFGPVAGNIRVDRDVVAVDQLELSALGGKITGQCIVEARGMDSQVAFRGKVTGVRPSSGDQRLDASAALTLVPYRLGLEGRVEIVRIDKSHLLELLDIYDPYHAEVAANRVRLGLKFGYPKQVRLHFQRGFASIAVELGGLAGAVRIDEMQGIPVGPALARWLAPVLEAQR